MAGCLGREPGPDLATSSFETLMPFAFSAAAALFLPGWLIQQPHGLLQPPGTDQAATYRRRCSEPGEALQQGEGTPRSEPGCPPGPPPSFPTAAGGSAGKGNAVCPAGCPVPRQQRGLRGSGPGRVGSVLGSVPHTTGSGSSARASACPQGAGGGAARHAITAATGAPLAASCGRPASRSASRSASRPARRGPRSPC